MQLDYRIEEFIRRLGLIEKGDRVLIAFSGGPDSTALLYLLRQISARLKFRLCAAYINHQIRPRAAVKELRYCAELCHRLGIDFVAGESDVPRFARGNSLSLEEAAREARYVLLEEIAREEKCNKIALGHHADDVVETIFFRLLRGTGPQGLEPMKPRNGKYIRPLLEVERCEIATYLSQMKISYLLDQTNFKADYSRNYIRNKVLPVIEKHFGAGYRKAVRQFAEIAVKQDRFLLGIAQAEFDRISQITPAGKILLDLNKLRVYDEALRDRVLKIAMEKMMSQAGAGSSAEITAINKIISGNRLAVSLKRGAKVFRERELLILSAPSSKISGIPLEVGSRFKIPGFRLEFSCRLIPKKTAKVGLQKGGARVNIDYDKIVLPLLVRHLRAGDSFQPLGMKGTKKVGDFLTDWKVPRFLREEILVVADTCGIVWVTGYQIDDKYKLDRETRKVLQIEIIRSLG